MLDRERFGKGDGIARAVDVGPLLCFGAGIEIVDGGEVEEVSDLPFELPGFGLRYAQVLFRELADNWDDTFFIDSPVRPELVHTRQLDRAHENVYRTFGAQEQFGNETFSDKAGGASDEVIHSYLPERVHSRRPIFRRSYLHV